MATSSTKPLLYQLAITFHLIHLIWAMTRFESTASRRFFPLHVNKLESGDSRIFSIDYDSDTKLKVWAIPLPISRPRDGQNLILILILIPRLWKCYKVKYEEMSKFIEWGTKKYKNSIPRPILRPRDVQNSIPIPSPLVSRFRTDSDSIADPCTVVH